MLMTIKLPRISNIQNTKVSGLFIFEWKINELSPITLCLDLTQIGRKIAEECIDIGKSKEEDPVVVAKPLDKGHTPEHKRMLSDAMVDVEKDRLLLTGDRSYG